MNNPEAFGMREGHWTSVRRTTMAGLCTLVLAACSSSGGGGSSQTGAADNVEGLAPTSTQLDGTWLQVGDPDWPLVSFNGNLFAIDPAGAVESAPDARGTYELNGREIHFTSQRSGDCADGARWTWLAGVPEVGKLNVVVTTQPQDDCSLPTGGELQLVRIGSSPSAQLHSELISSYEAEGAIPTTQELLGTWMKLDDGLNAEFDQDGNFAIGRQSPGETPAAEGTFEANGDTVTFLVEGGNTCPAGGTWEWQVTTQPAWVLHVVQGAQDAGPCNLTPGTKWLLVRVSDEVT